MAEHKLTVGQNGSMVVIVLDGRAVEVPHAVADAFCRALRSKVKEAEEYARAESGELIMDGAILFRAGVPVGLTSNPKIQAEIEKEAVGNRNLRRYMPGGIKSEERVGTPTITQSSSSKGTSR